MDDSIFLRSLAARGRVALLADGTAVPVPESVMDDEGRAGGAFIIDLISPEGTESGDGRTFVPGSIDQRELPLPLLWQFQLDEGHKGAVIVGRIDYVEQTDEGLGNARGVFDVGPWGQEAERLVRAGMLRGVSGDYSNFSAEVTPHEDEASAAGDSPDADADEPTQLADDKVLVKESKLVSATLVSKPAFEGCYIRMADDPDPDSIEYEDGVVEASASITASALIAGGQAEIVQRLERLEAIEAQLLEDELSMVASAARDRVEEHRLAREREAAIARMARARQLTAGGRLDDQPADALRVTSTKQARDRKGVFLRKGHAVRWKDQAGNHRHGHVTEVHHEKDAITVSPLNERGQELLRATAADVIKAIVPDTQEKQAAA